MKDKLRKFIQVKKEGFEQDFNADEVWSKIEAEIKKQPEKKTKINWFAAASLLLAITVSWLVYDRSNLNEQLADLEKIKVEGNSYQQIESYYYQTISQKSKLVQSSAEQIDYPISNDLKTLQIQYEKLKAKLKENGANDKIINAMILNLRTQIDLLNEQLEIIESINNYMKTEKKNETHI